MSKNNTYISMPNAMFLLGRQKHNRLDIQISLRIVVLAMIFHQMLKHPLLMRNDLLNAAILMLLCMLFECNIKQVFNASYYLLT